MKRKNDVSKYKGAADQELEIQRRCFEGCERLGILTGWFGDDFYTPDELQALLLLTAGKRVPAQLEKRLLETKTERMARYPEPGEEFAAMDTEKEFHAFLTYLGASGIWEG